MENIIYLSIYIIRSSLLPFPAITSETSPNCWSLIVGYMLCLCVHSMIFLARSPDFLTRAPYVYKTDPRARVCIHAIHAHAHMFFTYIRTCIYVKDIYLWSRNTFSCNMYTNMTAQINIYHLSCVYSSRLSNKTIPRFLQQGPICKYVYKIHPRICDHQPRAA